MSTEEEFECLIILLGNFYLTKTYIACIGKYLTGSGIKEVLVKTELFGLIVIENQIWTGGHYDRAVGASFMIIEALERIRIEEFLNFKGYNSSYDVDIEILKDLKESSWEKSFSEGNKLVLLLKQRYWSTNNIFIKDFTNFIFIRARNYYSLNSGRIWLRWFKL